MSIVIGKQQVALNSVSEGWKVIQLVYPVSIR